MANIVIRWWTKANTNIATKFRFIKKNTDKYLSVLNAIGTGKNVTSRFRKRRKKVIECVLCSHTHLRSRCSSPWRHHYIRIARNKIDEVMLISPRLSSHWRRNRVVLFFLFFSFRSHRSAVANMRYFLIKIVWKLNDNEVLDHKSFRTKNRTRQRMSGMRRWRCRWEVDGLLTLSETMSHCSKFNLSIKSISILCPIASNLMSNK